MCTIQQVRIFPSIWRVYHQYNACVTPEDTFLLLDALEQDAQALQAMSPCICLEIGCVKYSEYSGCVIHRMMAKFPLASSGSGCVSAFLSRIVGSSQSREVAFMASVSYSST